MTQVSRRVLSKKVEEKMFSLFFKSLAQLSNPADIQKFLVDLLSPSEQTMLAKRLAIAILLIKGYQYETIKSILKVSQETIARVNMVLNYQGEGYKISVQKIITEEKINTFFEKIEDTAIEILPRSSLKLALTEHRKTARKPKTALS